MIYPQITQITQIKFREGDVENSVETQPTALQRQLPMVQLNLRNPRNLWISFRTGPNQVDKHP